MPRPCVGDQKLVHPLTPFIEALSNPSYRSEAVGIRCSPTC
jgi:hypothetical protein